MTLVDTGPLVALALPGDGAHTRCVRAMATLRAPLITTWPCLAEAMYVVGVARGWRGQLGLWGRQQRGDLVLADMSENATRRCAELMEKYADVPMDLADATLVALAEERDETRIFTLDSDFHVYRLHGRRNFDVVP